MISPAHPSFNLIQAASILRSTSFTLSIRSHFFPFISFLRNAAFKLARPPPSSNLPALAQDSQRHEPIITQSSFHKNMISSGPRSPFHSPVFRRTGHSPALPERSSSFSFTQLPPIHDLLSPQSRPVVVQRPRGSTLPSYLSTDTTTFTSNSSRERPRMRRIGSAVSSSHEGDPYSDQDDENGSIMPGGVSLPPINDGSRQIHTFNGLPPIKTMLPSHRSPASSPQSIPRLSSSWSSNVPTLGSNGDHSDRFQRECSSSGVEPSGNHVGFHLTNAWLTLSFLAYSPPIGSQHKAFRMRTSPSPPTHVEDEYRHTTTTSLDDGFRRRQNIPKPSRSSLLSLTAPRQARNTPSESHNSGQRIREDVIMSSASTTPAPYPTTSAPSGRRDSHEDEKHSRQTTSGYSAPLYRYMSPGPESGPLGGSFELSETESMRLKPGETAGGKKRRSRATQEQLDLLNAVYQRTPFPTTVERNELANRLGMTPRSVQIW